MGLFSEITAIHFRNFTNLTLKFDSGINVFIGENGQGKTNILEAIYFISLLRSFRCNNLKNLIQWQQNFFQLSGCIEGARSKTRLKVQFGESRCLFINNTKITSGSEFIGRIRCVPFVSEDIYLVYGSGSDRRKFIDITLSQLYPDYLSSLRNYNKAIKSRNKLLKHEPVNFKAIDAYDSILGVAGALITRYRYQLCNQLNEHLADISPLMLANNDQLKLKYKFSYDSADKARTLEEFKNIYLNALKENIDKDIQYKLTSVGPHRDDFSIYFNEKSLADFGSEGQCRIAVLIIKMASGRLSNAANDNDVIYIVDDVFGELDEKRKKSFLKSLQDIEQVFMTTTENKIPDVIQHSSVYKINDGNVIKCKEIKY